MHVIWAGIGQTFMAAQQAGLKTQDLSFRFHLNVTEATDPKNLSSHLLQK